MNIHGTENFGFQRYICNTGSRLLNQKISFGNNHGISLSHPFWNYVIFMQRILQNVVISFVILVKRQLKTYTVINEVLKRFVRTIMNHYTHYQIKWRNALWETVIPLNQYKIILYNEFFKGLDTFSPKWSNSDLKIWHQVENYFIPTLNKLKTIIQKCYLRFVPQYLNIQFLLVIHNKNTISNKVINSPLRYYEYSRQAGGCYASGSVCKSYVSKSEMPT